MQHGSKPSVKMAASATAHCLLGCAIGEMIGVTIGTHAGFMPYQTVLLASVLSFVSGYTVSTVPLVRAKIPFKTALRAVFAADTVSILIMTIVDNILMLTIPGAMDKNLAHPVYWLSRMLALVAAFIAAFPVNMYLLRRGKGHALTHQYMHGGIIIMSNKFPDFLHMHAEQVAPLLLGCELVRTFNNGATARVKIVETEAYHQTDAASHSYRGQTPRTQVMFGPAGFAYVYFTYGMHYCFNVVTGVPGEGSAVLVRAVEPLSGVDILAQNRGGKTGVLLTNGPAKLCQALCIDKQLLGHNLRQPPLQLVACAPIQKSNIVATTRIGITRDTHREWRFYIRDNPYVSKP